MSTTSTDTAVLALVDYLTTELPTVTIRRGWPEADEELDLSAGAVIAVHALSSGEDIASPTTLGDVSGGEVAVWTGTSSAAVQLDVFAAYRADLDTVRHDLEAALSNALPFRPYLYLTDADGHAVTVIRTGDAPDVDGYTASQGQWRHTYRARVETDRLDTVTMPAIADIPVTVTLT